MQRGTIYALSAYLLWGVMALYWKQLVSVPAFETTAHRVIWSALLLAAILLVRGRWEHLRHAFQHPRLILPFVVTAILILGNWLVYLFAVNTNHIVEASLGYYINPLVNVLLGVVFLGERPRFAQWLAIGLATVAVGYMTIQYGRLPWIALSLAGSFGIYALLKKTTRVPAMEGMLLEMGFLSLPLGAYILWLGANGTGAIFQAGTEISTLLILAGVVTAAPLVLFSAGAQRVPMIVLGLLQYVAPTMQFFLGVAVFNEPFSAAQLIGFVLIWTALALFSVEDITYRRKTRRNLKKARTVAETPI